MRACLRVVRVDFVWLALGEVGPVGINSEPGGFYKDFMKKLAARPMDGVD